MKDQDVDEAHGKSEEVYSKGVLHVKIIIIREHYHLFHKSC